jgi:predicted MFS family arabinose efflux permease
MTERPSEASWLAADERHWITGAIAAEIDAKKAVCHYSILQAFRDRRVIRLSAVYFMVITGSLSNIYWIPTFVKRLSGASIATVTSILMIPAAIGLAATLGNGWHSDRKAERRWHAAAPLLIAGVMYAAAPFFSSDPRLSVGLLVVGSAAVYAFYPAFWSLPTMILSGTAAAATFGLIVSASQLGGIVGPYVIGFLNDQTQSLSYGFLFIALSYLTAAFLLLGIRIRQPSAIGDKEWVRH